MNVAEGYESRKCFQPSVVTDLVMQIFRHFVVKVGASLHRSSAFTKQLNFSVIREVYTNLPDDSLATD